MQSADFLYNKGESPCRKIGMEKANELFYAETGDPEYKEKTSKAKAICHSGQDGAPCQYLSECLGYAIANDEPWVYGGTTEQERTKIRRKIRMNTPRYRVPSS